MSILYYTEVGNKDRRILIGISYLNKIGKVEYSNYQQLQPRAKSL